MDFKRVLQKIIIGFVGALVLLTFFSQTIVDMRVPRVVLGFYQSGFISHEALSFGQVLPTGASDRFEIEAMFPQSQDFIRHGQGAEIQIGDMRLEGTVAQVTPGGGVNTVTIDVESNQLTGGEFAQVLINGGRWPSSSIIPLSALRQDVSGYYILYVESQPRLLGRSYYVRTARVDVGRRDMFSVAISGQWGQSLPEEPIIVNSDMPVFVGSRVRLVDGQD